MFCSVSKPLHVFLSNRLVGYLYCGKFILQDKNSAADDAARDLALIDFIFEGSKEKWS